MLVTINEILEDAKKNRYAVPAFDVSNYEMLCCVLDVCEEESSPALLMCLGVDLGGRRLRTLPAVIRAAAAHYNIPVCLQLDHATDFGLIEAAADAGFTSVMYDGSTLPFKKNAENTARVVRFAHARRMTVEAELGHVGNSIVGDASASEAPGTADNPEDTLTDPDEVARFVEITDVDALAVAIGTSHGIYRKTPALRIDRLDEITAVCDRPLVLHGGSGTPDEQIKTAIAHGICKVNIYSDVVSAINKSLMKEFEHLKNISLWPAHLFAGARESMKEVIRSKLRTFGSYGRA